MIKYVAYLFQGCNAPIVVKFADTQKEKEQKKLCCTVYVNCPPNYPCFSFLK
jgi:hypothetical protein